MTKEEIVDNRYVLQETIGQGAMGLVYRAYDRLTGREVALKRLRVAIEHLQHGSRHTTSHHTETEKANLLALAREFRILSSLRHVNIIQVLNYGIEPDRKPYIVMDYLANAQNIKQASIKSTVKGKINLILQVLQALAYLHRHGIVHRDLKIDNVMVVNGQVQVLDFGLSVDRQQAHGRSGTLTYMAPETIQFGVSSEYSDLYSVGVMLYELFAGKPPFEPQNISAILAERPDLTLLNVSATIRAIIEKLLSKQPADRYQSADEVINALHNAINRTVVNSVTAPRFRSYSFHTGFVGRSKELDTLRTALDQLEHGQGGFYLIQGSSGIGKSRLLAELRTYALVEGIQVLSSAVSPGITLYYQLWRQIVPHLATLVPVTAQEAAVLGEIAPDITRIVTYPTDNTLKESTGTVVQQRLIATITAVIKRLQQPTLILLDDIQWARESLDVLQQLALLVSDQPLTIIATYNPEFAAHLPERLPQADHLALSPLESQEIHEIAESILGTGTHQQALITLLEQETGGNPFLIVETLRGLLQDDRILETDTVTLDFERRVQRVIESHIKQIPESMQPILKLAATLGHTINPSLLESAFAPEQVSNWLMTVTEIGMIEFSDDQIYFVHDRTRQALIDSLSPTEKRQLYEQGANILEQHFGDNPTYAVLLAEHWDQAGHEARTYHYLKMAADFTFSRGLLETSANLLERAVSLSDFAKSDEERIELILMHGEAVMKSGRYNDALQIYASIADNPNHAIRYRAQALAHMGWITMRQENVQKSHELCRQAVDLATESNDHYIMALALKNMGLNVMGAGKSDEVEGYLLQALDHARAVNAVSEVASILNTLGLVQLIEGRHRHANKYFQESFAYFERLDDRWSMAVALHNQGVCHYNTGKYLKAEQFFQQSLELDRSINDRLGIVYHLLYIIHILLDRDAYADIDAYIDEMRTILDETNDRMMLAAFYNVQGRRHLYHDELDLALEDFEEMLAINQSLNHQPTIIVAWINIAWVRMLKGEWHEAMAIFTNHLENSQKMRIFWTNSEIYNGMAHCQERLGQHDDAIESLKASVSVAQRLDATPLLLESVVVYALVHAKADPVSALSWCYWAVEHPAGRGILNGIARPIIAEIEARIDTSEQEIARQNAANVTLTDLIQRLKNHDY